MAKKQSNTTKVLKRARKILSNPKRWTKREWARTDDGLGVIATDPKAACFCAKGAIQKACHVLNVPEYDDQVLMDSEAFLKKAFLDRGTKYPGIYAYNDAPKRKHVEVLRWFDRAIALSEAET